MTGSVPRESPANVNDMYNSVKLCISARTLHKLDYYLSREVEPNTSLVVEHQRQDSGAVSDAIHVETCESNVATNLRVCSVHESLPVLIVTQPEGT